MRKMLVGWGLLVITPVVVIGLCAIEWLWFFTRVNYYALVDSGLAPMVIITGIMLIWCTCYVVARQTLTHPHVQAGAQLMVKTYYKGDDSIIQGELRENDRYLRIACWLILVGMLMTVARIDKLMPVWLWGTVLLCTFGLGPATLFGTCLDIFFDARKWQKIRLTQKHIDNLPHSVTAPSP